MRVVQFLIAGDSIKWRKKHIIQVKKGSVWQILYSKIQTNAKWVSDVNAAQPLQRWILKRKHIVNAPHRKEYNQTSHENTKSRRMCYCVSESVCVTIAVNATFALYEAIFGSVHDSYLIHKQHYDSWCHENGAGNACVCMCVQACDVIFIYEFGNVKLLARANRQVNTRLTGSCVRLKFMCIYSVWFGFFFSSFYWYSKVMNGFDFKKCFNCDLVLF